MSLVKRPFAALIDRFLSGLWVTWSLSQLLKFDGPTTMFCP